MSAGTVKPLYGSADFFASGLHNLQPESPGAPTVYMPSPISGGTPPPRCCTEGRNMSAVGRDPSEMPFYHEVPPRKVLPFAAGSRTVAQHFDIFARFSALAAGLLTAAVGVCRLLDSRACLRWPREDFLADVNAVIWRQRLFILGPAAMCDLWIPFVFGVASLYAHFEQLGPSKANRCLIHSAWSIAQALFANLGYCGGLGIIAGALSAFAAGTSVVSFVLHKQISHTPDEKK